MWCEDGDAEHDPKTNKGRLFAILIVRKLKSYTEAVSSCAISALFPGDSFRSGSGFECGVEECKLLERQNQETCCLIEVRRTLLN